jgi:hypothetical protein
MEIQKQMIAEQGVNTQQTIQPKIKKNRVNQALVGVGILFVIIGIATFFTSLEIYYGIALIVAGVAMVAFVIKKGKDKLKKIELVNRLIREGKLKPKTRPIQSTQSIQTRVVPVTVAPVSVKSKIDLMGRMRGLMAGIKIAKIKKEQEKENILKLRLQATLDEIKRLKLSERRSQ